MREVSRCILSAVAWTKLSIFLKLASAALLRMVGKSSIPAPDLTAFSFPTVRFESQLKIRIPATNNANWRNYVKMIYLKGTMWPKMDYSNRWLFLYTENPKFNWIDYACAILRYLRLFVKPCLLHKPQEFRLRKYRLHCCCSFAQNLCTGWIS